MSLLTSSARRRARHAVYLVPHQDDEHLTLGAAIRSDVAAGLNVYAIIISDGKLDSARAAGTTTTLGYTPTYQDFSAARDREFAAGVTALGATPIVAPYEQRLPDGGVTDAGAVAMAKALSPVWGPEVRLRSTSTSDYHGDHRACGRALVQLSQEGWGIDPRLFISRYKAPLWPTTMTAMGVHGDLTLADQWAYRTKDVPNGWWGIGYDSVAPWFDYVLTVDGASYWHRPL